MKSILCAVGKASLCMHSAPETNDRPVRQKKEGEKGLKLNLLFLKIKYQNCKMK